MDNSELLFKISQNNKLGYINQHGNLVKQTNEKESLHVANYSGAVKKDELIPFESGDKFGYRTVLGDIKIPPQFENAGPFKEGMGKVGEYKGTWYYKGMPRHTYFWGYINEIGETLIDCKYINTYPFYEGVTLVQNPDPENLHHKWSTKEARWCLIDKKGQKVGSNKFEWAKGFSEGLAAVQKNGKYGFINTAGVLVIEPKFDNVTDFKNGIARVTIKDSSIPEEISQDELERDIIIISPKFRGKMGLIDVNGEMLIELQIDAPTNHFGSEYFDFHDGLCRIEKADKYGFIDINGNEVVPPIYDNAGIFQEGLASVHAGNKCGYINSKGDFVIDPQFVYGWEFSEGLAAIQKRVSIIDEKTGKKKSRLKWGFVNKRGEVVIEAIYSSVSRFHDGLAMVNFDKLMGYIDKHGKVIWKESVKK